MEKIWWDSGEVYSEADIINFDNDKEIIVLDYSGTQEECEFNGHVKLRLLPNGNYSGEGESKYGNDVYNITIAECNIIEGGFIEGKWTEGNKQYKFGIV